MYLDGNQLTSIPDSVSNLTKLKELSVEGNLITTIPICTERIKIDVDLPFRRPLSEQEKRVVALEQKTRSLEDKLEEKTRSLEEIQEFLKYAPGIGSEYLLHKQSFEQNQNK